jgi:multidrug efflux pump subunit AcrA (membrane-fusion protein)
MNMIPLLKPSGSVAILGVLLFSSGCRSGDPAAKAQGAQATSVQLKSVSTQMVDESEDFVATLESRKSVTLRPRVAGQVLGIFVKAGDRISAGTPVLQIDAREQLASVRSQAAGTGTAEASVKGAVADTARAKANLAVANAQLQTYKADLEAKKATLVLGEQQYGRYQKLRTAGAISQDVLDQYANTLKVSRANVQTVKSNIQAQQSEIEAQKAQINAQDFARNRAEGQVRQAEADTQEQRAKLQFYSITAPFDGTVGNVPVKEGDFVDNSTSLATLTQNSALEVNISVPIEKAARLELGTPVQLINDQGKRLATSRVFFISPKTSTDTQSVLVKAKVENATGQLRADQFVKARLIWQQRSSVLVPTVAISRIAGQNFVYVAQKGAKGLIAKQTPVQLGIIRGNSYQVTKGLSAGDKIVTSGIIKLVDGAPIAPETSKPAL